MRLVPSHSKLEGNEKADCAVKREAKKGEIEIKYLNLLANVKTELKIIRLVKLSA